MPQEQTCTDTTGHPTRKPTATLSSSSPRRRPREGDDRASSQQPELGATAASIEALTAPSAFPTRELNLALQTGSSKPLWFTGRGVRAIDSSPATNQETSASSITDRNGPKRPCGNKTSTNEREAVDDAKNAGMAKEDTDLTPNPPQHTGREERAQASSERQQFEIFDNEVLKASSKIAISGDRKHRVDLNT